MVQQKHQLSLERLPLGELAPLSQPLVLYIEASSYCNLACVFCPHHLDPERLNKQNMSLQVFKKVINDVRQFKAPLKMLRMCGTGDSLMNKQLPEMLEYAAANKNFEKFELITNGLLLNKELISSLTSSLSRLIISVEGLDENEYQKFTKRKINFEKFRETLLDLYKNKKQCQIHVKIHNNAVPSLEHRERFFSMFSDRCDEIYIENLVDLWPSTDASYVTTSEHRFVKVVPKPVKVCSQIFKTMQVNSDGTVIPCSIDWEAKNKIGDVTSETLEQIWNGDAMRELRLTHLKGRRFEFSPCSGCSFNESSDIDNIDAHAEAIHGRICAAR